MRWLCLNALVACAFIDGPAVGEGVRSAPQLAAGTQAPGSIAQQMTTGAQPSRVVQQAPHVAQEAAHTVQEAPRVVQEAPSHGVQQTRGALSLPDIDACVSRLDPQLDIGYDRIATRCPDLVRQLESAPWAAWLPRGWKEPGNDLSAGSLRELRELVSRESTARSSASRGPDVLHLKAILVALSNSRSESRWSRFKSWLRSVLETREQPTDESWLTRMVSQLGVSQSVLRLVTYAALGAVVLLACMIIVNEARIAGLSGIPGVARRKRLPATAGSSGISWNDIERAQPADRPRLLLEMIVRRLSDLGLLPPAGALTVREVTRAAQLPQADDRSRLSDLALAAERVRYSATRLESGRLEEPLARGRELLDRLEANGRAGAGTGVGGAPVGAGAPPIDGGAPR